MQEPTAELGPCLTQARAGSREALGQVLESFRAYLLLVANRELNPELAAKGSASDIVQLTFLEAQQDFDQFAGNSASELQAWLRRLLLNNLSNFVRHYQQTEKREVSREVSLDLESSSGPYSRGLAGDVLSPSGEAMAHEGSQSLEKALARLPEDYSAVIVWRHRDGLSFAEIAERMNRSENAVRKLWFRAIEKLQTEIDESF